MPVYLDHAATTPMLPAARDAYVDALGLVGNPSSIHSQGQQAKRMLEEAREVVAASLGAEPIEVVFTSGGTESINLGVKGLYWARQKDAARPVVLLPGGEHHATVDAVEWLERHEGARVVSLRVDEVGRLLPSVLEEALAVHGASVALVTLLWANNEVGTVQPVAELVAVAERFGVPVHLDAVAAYGYLPIDFGAVGAAVLSVSAHKIGGPVGIGALVVGRRSEVEPLIHGGNQQRVRSGTQDVAGAVGFAAAARGVPAAVGSGASGSLSSDGFLVGLAALRDRLVAGVREAVPEAVLRGDPSPEGRLPGNAHVTFPGCEGDSLLFLLDMAGFSVSTGSACQAGVPEVSHVLTAMGVPEAEARGALRFTLGHGTTEAEVDALVAALPAAYAAARKAGFADRVV
ncbi:cysteine desulfurase family protein [Herbiconiux sp. KACC 21604]|uniref:cysteine desulfurase family protein n=1 Tax=unclassified Herbiconiux TaxID=2618217 RepID=UPI00149151B4|nr:cysteine desulfurase family protein [Herbiconiux sp. SALV-R1]QJU52886.1 cysteine desulfurase [Herbiconiux sp. SALV-R1]WPO87806.1 cysteine desulfurase family protein [Herbiconiux sp. KACC 21604]